MEKRKLGYESVDDLEQRLVNLCEPDIDEADRPRTDGQKVQEMARILLGLGRAVKALHILTGASAVLTEQPTCAGGP